MSTMYKQIDANKRATVLLFIVAFGVLVGLGWTLSYVFAEPGILWIAVIIAVIQAWVGYFYSDKVALAVSGAKEAPREQYLELHRLVENLAITAGLPKPRTYIINDPSPNAFATGRNPENAVIAVTTGLLEKLDKQELEGVVAHEMAHIGNRDILVMTVAVTMVGAIVLISDIFIRSLWFRGGMRSDNSRAGGVLILVGILMAILAPLFAKLIQLAVSRKREYVADATGALLTRYPEGLASALEKIAGNPQPLKTANRATAHMFIEEPFGARAKQRQSWFATVFSTHPPAADRVRRLREMA
jgi:heat shock protein HtpX